MNVLLQSAQPIPYSAFLLCYLPLATVVFGLLALFALTDWHARRPYLRFNPFVAATVPPEELKQRAPASGETPAGSLGGGGATGAPTTYVGAAQDIIPTKDTDPPASPGVLRETEEDIGEVPPIPKPGSALTDRLNRPAGTEDDDPNRYA